MAGRVLLAGGTVPGVKCDITSQPFLVFRFSMPLNAARSVARRSPPRYLGVVKLPRHHPGFGWGSPVGWFSILNTHQQDRQRLLALSSGALGAKSASSTNLRIVNSIPVTGPEVSRGPATALRQHGDSPSLESFPSIQPPFRSPHQPETHPVDYEHRAQHASV